MSDGGSSVRPIVSVGSVRQRAADTQLVFIDAELPTPLDPRLVLLAEPSTPRADAFRLARHRLEQRKDPRLVAVTSVATGDGKTTLAANLALAIAEERGPSVLLVDAHRTRPALAEMFGLRTDLDLLPAASSHRYALQRVADTGLCVGLALGQVVPISQAERDALRVALTDLRLSFDYVIIDAGAALDGMLVHWIAELVDGVLFAVRRGVTERRILRRAIDGLAPVPLAGAVVLDG